MTIYLVYTIVGFIALVITGLSLFEAITIAFTSIATGGFMVTEGFYTNPYTLIVVIMLMICGATSFALHDKLFKKRWIEFFSDYRLRIFISLLIIGTAIMTILGQDFLTTAFQLVSSLTGTGFSVVENNALPHLFLAIIVIFMIIGGMLGSTSGGIKISRFYIAIKSIPWYVSKLIHPSTAIIPFKIRKDNVLEDHNVVIILIFIIAYLCFAMLGTLIFLVLGFGFLDSIFQVVSAIGTVGLQTISLTALPLTAKMTLTVLMILGRLEIFPVLILLRMACSPILGRIRH